MLLRHTSSAALLATVALLLAAPATAQQGTLTGRVIDAETGRPLPGAGVRLVGTRPTGPAEVLTDAAGRFRLSAPVGRYSVVVALVGYESGRVEGIDVPEDGAASVEISLTSRALRLNPIVVTASRGRQEKALDAPASVTVVPAERITERAAVTPVEHVKALPGVDVVQTGLQQSNTVARGFNNVFSGAMLVMVDNRYAAVPSLRLNAYDMIPTTPMDVERIEVLLGPAAALYGPNSANGVMHMITSSPIDRPGHTISISGGERAVLHGAFRSAWAGVDGRLGFKVSGQYFRGDDWQHRDSAEVLAARRPGANALVAARSFEAERWGGEARLDYRAWDDGEVILSYGVNQLVNSIELTGIGAGQAKDWRYQFGHARLRKGRLFAQGFVNWSDAGDTYLLRTGQPIVNKSNVMAGQAQYGIPLGEAVELLVGVDAQRTTPKTEGTINGENEDDDEITEIGGYVHGTLALTDRLDLVGALRVDDHDRLEDPNWSPRAALVLRPSDGQNLRLTYNRAFSTPSSNNLFLDIVAGSIPLGPTVGYDVRTRGVPTTGFTFDARCTGGVQELCMYSPFAPQAGRLPANAAVLWDDVLVPLALSDPQLRATLGLLGITPGQFAAIIGNPGPDDLTSLLLRFNQETPSTPFQSDAGVRAVDRIRPTITTTFELGYKGLIADRVSLSADLYNSRIKDFVGPLRVETPSVFLEGTSVAQFLVQRLTAAQMPASVAGQIAAGIASTAARLPVGTVAPDQRSDSDLILTYRNFGDVELWGLDVGARVIATDRVSLSGSFSWVSEECFDFNEDGSCTSTADVSLNAPTLKGALGVRYADALSGFSADARLRVSEGFTMNSGVFLGRVEGYGVVDANLAYNLPWAPGAQVSLTVTNLLDDVHREFVGAPELGRLALLRLRYAF